MRQFFYLKMIEVEHGWLANNWRGTASGQQCLGKTQQHRSLSALRCSRPFLHSFGSYVIHVIVSETPESHVISCNPCQCTSYSQSLTATDSSCDASIAGENSR